MLPSKTTTKTFAWVFIATGVFAIVGALFSWGEGWLFSQERLLTVLLPAADLLVAGPLSLLAGRGMLLDRRSRVIFGLMASGVYLFGSVLVYVLVFWQGPPYPMRLVIPPIFGVSFSFVFLRWVFKVVNIYAQAPATVG